ncbi:MAG: hypothetical protein KGJ57_15230 [Sphingomonadales bacterium]|nr:hypothetical protein [Sphingomonadales bacterium]MDE2170757.1 hypothetical protein [Sphingomonadales bacterium]
MTFIHERHYFVNIARNFGIDRPQLGDMQRGMGSRIRPEDIDAIEAIERVLQSGATLPSEISARVEKGALKVRRRLEFPKPAAGRMNRKRCR